MAKITYHFLFILFVISILTGCAPHAKTKDVLTLEKQINGINISRIKEGVIAVNKTTEWDYMLLTEPYIQMSAITKNIKLSSEDIKKRWNMTYTYESDGFIFLIKDNLVIDSALTRAFSVKNSGGVIFLDKKDTKIRYQVTDNISYKIVISK